MGGNYWDRTDRVVRANGGHGPRCGSCNQPKTPIDDHGRFVCANSKCPSNAGKSFGEMMNNFTTEEDDGGFGL